LQRELKLPFSRVALRFPGQAEATAMTKDPEAIKQEIFAA
jgi:hypothetical protein